MAEGGRSSRSWRRGLTWVGGAALLAAYLSLPEGDDAYTPAPIPSARVSADSRKLTIMDVVPGDPASGSAVIVTFSGGPPDTQARLLLGKLELAVLARQTSSLVAQLPADLPPGRVKIRLAADDERSKPYELRIKPVNWRKPFRNLCGGLALLVLGLQTLSRGAQGMFGISNARPVAALARSPLAAASFGAVAGSIMQSSTGLAGLLAGLVGSRVLSEASAAAAFLGTQLGAAAVPLLVANIVEPRGGLIAVAIGALALGLAPDRRSRAHARVILGAGLVAFGVQVLRPGLEPFMSEPMLLATIDRIAPDGALGTVVTALLGALLVAVFQGPAPVLMLALGISEVTGHSNVRTTLVLLSGSGLGAGLAALLTIPGGARCRRLGQLNLVTGAASTLLAVLTVDGFSRVANVLVAGHAHPIRYGKHLFPATSWQVAVAFVLSQLAAALVLLPLLPSLQRGLERMKSAGRSSETSPLLTDAMDGVRRGLLNALSAQRTALPAVLELSLLGARDAGRIAEHRLLDARALLQSLFSGPVLALPSTLSGSDLGKTALGCMQLQRSLETVLRQAEQLIENRIAWTVQSMPVPALPEHDQSVLREMHGLMSEGIASLVLHLRTGTRPDPDETRAREIQMNATELRSRHALLADRLEAHDVRRNLDVIELIDAYETAGNQLYRVTETLGEAEGDSAQFASPTPIDASTGSI